jgi:hypothetical protein
LTGLTGKNKNDIRYLHLERCVVVDYEASFEMLSQFNVEDVRFTNCYVDLSRFVGVLTNVQYFGILSDDNENEGVCSIIDQCIKLKHLDIKLFRDSGPTKILKSISQSNLCYVDLCDCTIFAPFLVEVGTMLKLCKSLKEFRFKDVITRASAAEVQDNAWAVFCEGVSNSHLEKFAISFRYSENIFCFLRQNMLNAAIAMNPNLKSVEIDVFLSVDTLPCLAALVNHVKHLRFDINGSEFISLDTMNKFAQLISDSSSLRSMSIRSASSKIFYEGAPSMCKIITRSGHILETIDCLFLPDMDRMTRRNQNNLKSCQLLCETLLALIRFRGHEMNPRMGRDMVKLLSMYLLKTWPDVEAWTQGKNSQ